MKNFPCLKAREITSAITLSTPAMCLGMRPEAPHEWMDMPNIRSSLPAAGEVDALSLSDHDTADVLSQYMPRWQNVRGTPHHSSANQPSTMAANSKSLMSISPSGLE